MSSRGKIWTLKRCIAGAVLAISAAVPTLIAAPGTAHAAAPQWGTMKDGYGLCLDDTNYSTSGGTQMQVWTCNGKASQNWHIYATIGSPTEYMFQVQQSGMCLDEYQGTGPKVIQWPCNTADTAQWWIGKINANGGYQFFSASAPCATMAMDAADKAGAKVSTQCIADPGNTRPDDSWGLPPFAYP